MKKLWIFIGVALFVSVILAAIISPFASSDPDGLEKVSEERGFAEREAEPLWKHAFMPGYWAEDESGHPTPVRKALAGIAGTLLVFGIGFGVAKLFARKKPAGQSAAAS